MRGMNAPMSERPIVDRDREETSIWHALPISEVAARLEVSAHEGLTRAAATARREQYGPNELPAKGGRTLWGVVKEQFRDIVIWVLLVATLVSALTGEFLDAAVIIAIVALNAVMGVVQERKAEQSLAALQRMASPIARLLRDGVPVDVPAREVVPGDLLFLEAGRQVPADARLLDAVDLRLDESSLTGESLPVEKDATALLTEETPPDERTNLVFMGTAVTHGRGRALVVTTGTRTELGRIATMLGGIEAEKTPLQTRLEELGRWLAGGVLAVCAVVFVAGALRGLPLLELFMTSVSLAVAAIPEGLPAVVTIVLALGMQNMVRRHAIVRRLRAVEALGSTTVICTDKTGTLTQNRMTVSRFLAGGATGMVSGAGDRPTGQFTWDEPHAGQLGPASAPSSADPTPNAEHPTPDADLPLLLELAVLCSDARLVDRDGGWQIVGDPTEGALLMAAAKAGLRQEALEAQQPRRGEVPFDADRKRMSTLHQQEDRVRVCVKGAPDLLLRHCTRWRQNGRELPLGPDDRERLLAFNAAFAGEALRVLGFAYRDLPDLPEPVDAATVEAELIFAGLLGMSDPPRPEARAAVERCRAAGIRPVMVTGDYPATARAVARELGLAMEGTLLTGEQLRRLDAAALREMLPTVSIFARVSPTDKLRIVEACQAADEIVAMTGDGVNDAPALKRADIGVAMGLAGTDVARGAADIVLTDDNFASIVAAVEEGRGIFANIRRFVFYLLSCNLSEVLVIFLAILAGLPHPLIPVQLLWINLVTDGLPALALGVEPKDPGLMERPPRAPRARVVDAAAGVNILWYGGCLTLVTLLAFLHGLYWFHLRPRGMETFGEAAGALFHPAFWTGMDLRGPRTLAFTTLGFAQLAHSFNCRSATRSLFSLGWRTNPHLIAAVGISALALLAVVYVPLFQPAFGTVPVTGRELGVLVALSLAPLLLGEARKAWQRRTVPRLRVR
jgi:Ca2+-transporting ATPase